MWFVVTSSPSMNGRFMVLAMNCATVLLPEPAGPVMSHMWCLVSGLFEGCNVPLDIVFEDDGAEMGMFVEVACAIVGLS